MNTLLALLMMMTPLADAETTENHDDYAWKNRVELSYVGTTGNASNTTFASSVAIEGAKAKQSVFFNLGTILQNTNGVETGNQTNMRSRYEHKMNERVFFLLDAGLSVNKFAGYDYQLSGGPGFGIDILTNEQRKLKIFASVDYHIDDPVAADQEANRYTAIKFTANAGSKPMQNLQLNNALDFSQSTKEQKKYLVKNTASAQVKINSHLAVGFTHTMQYDNLPPVVGLEKMNTQFMSSLVVTW